ncbi:MAG: DUF4350 domain-containing protein [Rubrivivax sp.]|nr:DUF4350 domain-containing protein [Pyrinomonadaceae bacterium]
MFSNRLTRAAVALLAFCSFCAVARAQQVADPDFKPAIARPAYRQGRGPRVLLDEAHHNFHTATGRYQPFAELLRRDGYVVEASAKPFNRESLKGARVLVIANALAERNIEDWSLPNPSAFTDEEIEAVREWVRRGGSLLLIADHMPMGGAAEKLGAAFGVRWNNGFALVKNQQGPLVFRREDSSLKDHAITRGGAAGEKIERVATFTGSAFQIGEGAEPLLVFDERVVSLMPQVAWQFTPETPEVSVKGWAQGATLRFGKGRVALFGEAAMFTAQLAGPNRTRVGMNAPEAKQNPQFLLNVLHWLSGKI